MEMMNEVVIGLLAFGGGFLLAFWVRSRLTAKKIQAAEEEATSIVAKAEKEASTSLKEAKLHANDPFFLSFPSRTPLSSDKVDLLREAWLPSRPSWLPSRPLLRC